MSELTYACSLSNSTIRSILRPYISKVSWTSPLAKDVVGYFTDPNRVISATFSPAEIRSYLSDKCLDDEIERILTIAHEHEKLTESEVGNVIEGFEAFYKKKFVSKVLDENIGDVNEIIRQIKDLQKINKAVSPVSVMGDLDVDEVIAQELGSDGAIPTSFKFIERATPWKGYMRGQLCMVVAPPGVGKSLFIANEVVEFLRHGLKVYWLALGDMLKLDFIIRLSALITGVDYYKVSMNPKRYFTDEVKRITKNLRLTVQAAGSIDIHGVIDLINTTVIPTDDIDVFVLDYDSNLETITDNMYSEGNATYNALSALSRPEGRQYRLVMVASQPKIHYWDLEELPKESAGESSRKQAIVDLIVTIGKNYKIRQKHAGIMKAAKARRGKENEKSCYVLSDCGVFQEIDRSDYVTLTTFEG